MLLRNETTDFHDPGLHDTSRGDAGTAVDAEGRPQLVPLPLAALDSLLFRDSAGGSAPVRRSGPPLHVSTVAALREAIAGRAFEAYATAAIHGRAIVEAHRQGRITIHLLDDPLRPVRLMWRPALEEFGPLAGVGVGRAARASVPAGGAAAAPGGPRTATPSAWSSATDGPIDSLFARWQSVASWAGDEFHVEGLSTLIAGSPDEQRARAARVLHRLASLGETAGSPGLTFDLGIDALPWLEAQRAEFEGPVRGWTLRLRVGGSDAPDAEVGRALAAALWARGDAIEFLPPAERTGWLDHRGFRGGVSRSVGAVFGKVTLHLARLARRTVRDRGPTSTVSPFFARRQLEIEIEEAVDFAVSALAERAEFLGRVAERWDLDLWRHVQPRTARYSLGVIGLEECVQTLLGVPRCSPRVQGERAAELGIEILRLIAFRARDAGALRDLRIEVGESSVGELPAIRRDESSGETAGVRWPADAPLDPFARCERLVPYLDVLDAPGRWLEDLEDLRGDRELFASLLRELGSLPCGLRPSRDAGGSGRLSATDSYFG